MGLGAWRRGKVTLQCLIRPTRGSLYRPVSSSLPPPPLPLFPCPLFYPPVFAILLVPRQGASINGDVYPLPTTAAAAADAAPAPAPPVADELGYDLATLRGEGVEVDEDERTDERKRVLDKRLREAVSTSLPEGLSLVARTRCKLRRCRTYVRPRAL